VLIFIVKYFKSTPGA